MRRWTLGVIALGAAVLASGPTPVYASAPAAGKKVCTVTDQRLSEISGLAATANGYLAVNSATQDQMASHKKIFLLDKGCQVSKIASYGGSGSLDPQDIAIGKDGLAYIADVGDIALTRSAIAIWQVPADLSAPARLFHLSYPDGPHNARAMLLSPDGTPIVVTFETNQTARLYVPTAALSATATVPMKLAATVNLINTLSPNVFGGAGRKGIVAGAVSPDGSKVALSSYADVFEWDVAGGNILAAVKQTPRVTPLAGAPFNESLTYSSDGKLFLSASMTTNVRKYNETATTAVLMSWSPNPNVWKASADVTKSAGKSAFTKWLSSLTLDETYLLLAGVSMVGLAMVAVGLVAIAKSKRRPGGRRQRDDVGLGDDEYGQYDPAGKAPAVAYGRGYDHRGGQSPGGGQGRAPLPGSRARPRPPRSY